MKSLADGLPPEISRQVHPDWRKNEAEYWTVRDQLLGQYRDQWVAFAGGKVVASGRRPVEVFHAARQSGEHPFVVCVGHEMEPFRIRRAAFPCDTNYLGEPRPVIRAEFRTTAGVAGQVLDRVILDTGADTKPMCWLLMNAVVRRHVPVRPTPFPHLQYTKSNGPQAHQTRAAGRWSAGSHWS